MQLYGWGKFPKVNTTLLYPHTIEQVLDLLSKNASAQMIARGLGRSYGDSAIAENTLDCCDLDHFLDFDEANGILTCQAGVSIATLLSTFAPKGWWLPVVPGTKHVTIGGAIASDVHGKNHHIDGCFSHHVISFKLISATGQIITCSRKSHEELFYASCGGMGLTGIILQAKLQLMPIKSSYITHTLIKTKDLEETIAIIDAHSGSRYCVAWLDCMSHGKHFGRSLVSLGEHASTGGLDVHKKAHFSMPKFTPGVFLNQYTVKLFNFLYYNQARHQCQKSIVHYDGFFFPLDKICHANNIYGNKGLIQYQFVLPQSNCQTGLAAILKKIVASKQASFLSVLKSFGKSNDNYLSFPLQGYSLALDFKINKKLFPLLEQLDKLVLTYGGRLYLSKDARMSEQLFKQSYPNWRQFQDIRQKYHADKVFNSFQSARLGL
jgi:decaprenylphospho-beta-D-ribofuranose 2-oxidase